jgi:hypothetical protein
MGEWGVTVSIWSILLCIGFFVACWFGLQWLFRFIAFFLLLKVLKALLANLETEIKNNVNKLKEGFKKE